MKQVYFPFTPDGQRYPIEVQDTTGKDWKFYFRAWRNGHGRMYVLEGVRKYMALIDWKAGDKGNYVPHHTTKLGNPYSF